MSESKNDKDKELERPVVAKTAVELQRLKLMKLMKNPDKSVLLPERPKTKSTPSVPEFVRNVMGSSAGAGSGEFHVYRHLRRKEYARQKFIQEKSKKELLDLEYQQKLEQNKFMAEQKTAKKRAKRLKKKEKLKQLKRMKVSNKKENSNTPQNNVTDEDSTDNSDDDNNQDEKKIESNKEVSSKQTQIENIADDVGSENKNIEGKKNDDYQTERNYSNNEDEDDIRDNNKEDNNVTSNYYPAKFDGMNENSDKIDKTNSDSNLDNSKTEVINSTTEGEKSSD